MEGVAANWYVADPMTSPSRRTVEATALLLAAALAPAGCGEIQRWLGDGGDDDSQADGGAIIPKRASDLGAGAASPLRPLERAERKMDYPAKDASHLGFNLQALSKTYSLAGAVEVPAWAKEGVGDPLVTRDDDIATAWRCTADDDAPCAFGMSFPEPARVTAIRLWANAPHEPADHARISELKVHTDEGWAKVRFGEEQDFVYVVFGQPVDTTQLTVEFVDVHAGHKGHEIWLGDIEAYGDRGATRAGLDIDPTAVVVRHGKTSWKRSGLERQLSPTHLEIVKPDATAIRLGPGSAIYGRPGDRLLLVEQLLQTVCNVHKGRYFAIDTKTRVWIPLGDLGGMLGDVYRQEAGEGWAVGFADEEHPKMQAMLLEEGVYMRRKTQRMASTTTAEYFEQWRIPVEATLRGGVDPRRPTGPCKEATAETIAPLATAYDGKLGAPAQWSVCDLGAEHAAYLFDGGGCGKRWELHVVSDKGRTVASRKGKAAQGAAFHVRSSEALGLLVEVTSDDVSATYLVRSDDIVDLPPNTALAVRAPASCGARCDAPFVNPRRPD